METTIPIDISIWQRLAPLIITASTLLIIWALAYWFLGKVIRLYINQGKKTSYEKNRDYLQTLHLKTEKLNLLRHILTITTAPFVTYLALRVITNLAGIEHSAGQALSIAFTLVVAVGNWLWMRRQKRSFDVASEETFNRTAA